jgi:hypothetical protein
MNRTRSSFSISIELLLSLSSVLIVSACGGSNSENVTTLAEGVSAENTGEMQETSVEESTTSGSETTGDTETTAGTEATGGTETNGGTETTNGTDDDGTSVKFDLGPVPDSPMLDESCGMVDFLFVIDNSGSMSDEQNALINNFPSFITGIKATLETVDSIHVGVTTTDENWFNVPGCTSIGSLVVQTGGSDSSNSVCGPYEEGANFMTEMDDLDIAFSCAARVGTDGSADERQMEALIHAVDGTYAGKDQCNEGFIREDALLVIVLITDEPDINSQGDSKTWFDAVVEAKEGIPENVVVVSLISTPMGNCGFEVAWSIAEFTELFGINGFMADICLPDFAPVFDKAVAIIDVACDNFLQD